MCEGFCQRTGFYSTSSISRCSCARLISCHATTSTVWFPPPAQAQRACFITLGGMSYNAKGLRRFFPRRASMAYNASMGTTSEANHKPLFLQTEIVSLPQHDRKQQVLPCRLCSIGAVIWSNTSDCVLGNIQSSVSPTRQTALATHFICHLYSNNLMVFTRTLPAQRHPYSPLLSYNSTSW